MGKPNYFDVKYANLETRERYRQYERDAMLYDIAESIKQPQQYVSTYNQFEDIKYYKDNIDSLIENEIYTRKYEKEKATKNKMDYNKEKFAQLLCDRHKLECAFNSSKGMCAEIILVLLVYVFVVIAILIGEFENSLVGLATIIAICLIALLQIPLTIYHKNVGKKLDKINSEINSLLDVFEQNK